MLILNSGSWLFDGEKINQILKKLENYVIGCRAMKYSNLKRLSCDDHFVFINLKILRKKYFSRRIQKFLPFDYKYGGIHTLLNNFLINLTIMIH